MNDLAELHARRNAAMAELAAQRDADTIELAALRNGPANTAPVEQPTQ